jgi:hypothetical protein
VLGVVAHLDEVCAPLLFDLRRPAGPPAHHALCIAVSTHVPHARPDRTIHYR